MKHKWYCKKCGIVVELEEELGGPGEEKPSEEKDKEWNKDNENTGTGEDLREADTTTSDEE